MSVPKRQVTEDGFKLQFGTKCLGPFALTMALLPALMLAQSPRVTTVSSGAANMGLKKINFGNLCGLRNLFRFSVKWRGVALR